ncbi:unnamed protein product [Symbiodinium pilosum]|uniref:RRM domain-containing protein n=1 Tax=Symbiodinium pilosum TaxID=2952 RepID=A0A812IZ41_SYMPI|nr:unnamed protein product [Symbiodinium pilosum]
MQVFGGGPQADFSCLLPLPKPDVTLQKKYDAMGLPDPVAFALLTALGAIKDPMGMLNEMMNAAQALEMQELQRKQASSSFKVGPMMASEASDSAELERLAKQVKEAAEQARAATVAGGLAAADAAANSSKNVAQAFAEAEEEEEPRPALGQTLSSLLTGREKVAVSGDSGLALPTTLDKVAIRLPPGVSEAAVRLECARHGVLTAVVLEPDSSAAYVCFSSSDMAQLAVRRMANKSGIFGGSEPLQIKLISELPESARNAAVPVVPALSDAQPVNPADLPEYLRPRKSRSRSARKRASRSARRRKRKSRSAKRWLDRSRSNSHTATGQYIRATGCSSTVRWWEKRREDSDSDRSTASRKVKRAQKAEAELVARRPRQVAIKGLWAQFVHCGVSYYFNIQSEETVLEKPSDFEDGNMNLQEDRRRASSVIL